LEILFQKKIEKSLLEKLDAAFAGKIIIGKITKSTNFLEKNKSN